jgi:CHAD domain-containing protein
VKKLSCAAEFFGDLFKGKQVSQRRQKFVAALEHLQDGLGDLNDITVDENPITTTRLRRQRRNPKRAFAAGLLTRREDANLDAAMTAATEGYAAFVEIKPFWQ